MSLYLKYRPSQLSGIKGNSALIDTLSSVLEKEEKPHVFLLTGPSGCGKTTIGRIIANKLECIGGDLREIDSADFRGIDTIREIRSQSQFMPLESPCKVWIMDECHKLSGDAQSALLKMLEDTPKHVYFILCTTDPQKLLPTVIGRCSQYQVSLLKEEELVNLMKRIVKLEKEKVDQEILESIARDSEGHARNALQVLEQVLSTEPEKRAEIAQKAAMNISQTIDLCRTLLSTGSSWKKVSGILAGLQDQDPEGIRRAVLGYCKSILLKSENDRAAMVMEIMVENFYSSGFPGLVFACYQIVKS